MNFLAHIYLGGSDLEHIAGSFFGDFVKGSNLSQYPQKIQEGIKLHRKIDHFTDTHEIVKKGKSRLWDEFRHYSGVLIDMYYDHFLAKNWSHYSDIDLRSFSEDFYQRIKPLSTTFSDSAQLILSKMSAGNWLYHYGSLDGMNQAFEGISRKASFDSGMENAGNALQKYYEEYEQEFQEFFPQIIEHSQAFLKESSK